ncbi:acyl-CoA thioesterase [Aciduricibacillus chroicocephali]|uniref:Acyl-CoA thioesterase n=1 Tax=Aciduricibacillus chroicocephali TaxID=3054939 RepID=A0ABY9KW83_9BACI|nr:acyl-CoA thioesterase [Bacillaceae bacterium 44XB]
MKKPIAESRTVQSRLVLPANTNHIGTIFGGNVLAYIDEIGAIAAMKHSESTVVTASIDSVNFVSSAKTGDVLNLEAIVTYTGTTSMEVYVRVSAHNLLENREQLTTESFLTMVAVDEEGHPKPVPKVYPETPEEIRLHETAPARKKHRIRKAKLR